MPVTVVSSLPCRVNVREVPSAELRLKLNVTRPLALFVIVHGLPVAMATVPFKLGKNAPYPSRPEKVWVRFETLIE